MRKQKYQKFTLKICCLILCLPAVFSLFSFTVSATDERTDRITVGTIDYQKVAEDETLSFYADFENGYFFVFQKATGVKWFSNPMDVGYSAIKGVERTNKNSILLIDYLDEKKVENTTNSFVESNRRNGLTVQTVKGGLRLTFRFPKLGFTIPVEITIKNGRLIARVLNQKIKETGKNKIYKISLLPYFGATGVGSEGYLFIPDGCGAIAEFGQQVGNVERYCEPVYGKDPTKSVLLDSEQKQQIYLPVFGIKIPQASVTAVIDDSAEVADIHAAVASGKSLFNMVYAGFNYRTLDTTHLQEFGALDREVKVVTKQGLSSKFCSVTYLFQNTQQADYVGMANAYKNYLLQTWKLEKSKGSETYLNLSFQATTEVKKAFLGIPYTGIEALTTCADLEKAVDYLQENGCNKIHLAFIGANTGGMYGKIPKSLKIDHCVGTEKKFRKLCDKIELNGNTLWLLSDFSKLYKSGNGLFLQFSTVRNVSGAVSKQYRYYLNTFNKQALGKTWQLVNANAMDSVVTEFCKSVSDRNIGIYEMASVLYGDYKRNQMKDRIEMCDAQRTVYQKMVDASGKKMYFDQANLYAMEYASMISGLPLFSSQFDLLTRDVPFYQIVLRGLCDGASVPVNLEPDYEEALLKSIEYGCIPTYKLIGNVKDNLIKTGATDCYSCDMDYWLPKAVAVGNEIADFYRDTASSNIVAHTCVADLCYQTIYENGSYSLVNYGSSDVNYHGVTVSAKSYAFAKKEEFE